MLKIIVLALLFGCGIQPIKPIVPIGCRDLVILCACDAEGQNCHYEWICVR